jgi:hypothetical protein
MTEHRAIDVSYALVAKLADGPSVRTGTAAWRLGDAVKP